MDSTLLKSNLSEKKAKLKQKFASLTDDDFLLEEGRREEREGKHQTMLFQSKDELKKILSSL